MSSYIGRLLWLCRTTFVVFVLLMPVFLTNSVSATSSTLSISVPSTPLSLTIDSLSPGGTFAVSDSMNVSVTTNNYSGFTLSIKAANATNLVGDEGFLPTLPANSSLSAEDFRNNSNYVNMWGYKSDKFNSIDNNSFHPSPDTESGDIIDNHSSAGTNVVYSFAIGAKIDVNQPAGEYSNTFIITAVANGTPYSITYNANAGGDSTVVNLPTNPNDNTNTIGGITYTDIVALDSTVPTRDGYSFAGWCVDNTSQNSCSGTLYNSANGNLSDFPIDLTMNSNGINVYAIWSPLSYTITLNNLNATTNGNTSATATFGSSVLTSITNPSRQYSISGFTKTNSAYNATVSSTATLTYSWVFSGWYTASSGGSKVINSDGTLVANVSNGDGVLTNSSGQWVSTNDTTLYARWAAGAKVKLPSITQTDATYGNGSCYWSKTNSATGSSDFSSASTVATIASDAVLYGVCKFPITISFAGSGVSQVEVRSGSASGTLVGTVSASGGQVSGLAYGTRYYLVPTYSAGYELSSWAKNSTYGTLSSTSAGNPYVTVGTTSNTGSVGITITGKQIYIQNFTLAQCESKARSNFTVFDRRDGSDYTVRYINGECWMTSNLRITGSISPTYSNFSGSSFNVSQYSMNSNDSTYSGYCDGANGYNHACANKQSGKTGTFYNYYAATAGTISSDNNTNPATSDICPSNWHLPSGPNTTTGTDFNLLIGNANSGFQTEITDGLTAFGYTSGARGIYYNGKLLYTSNQIYYWGSTATSGTGRNRLLFYMFNGAWRFIGSEGDIRHVGLLIRCVRSS